MRRLTLSIFPTAKRGSHLYRVVLCCREGCTNEFLVDASKPLSIHQIVTDAKAAGWICDKRGYAICPTHKNEPLQRVLSPQQKRAAYVRIMMEEEAEKLREKQRYRDQMNKLETPKSWSKRKRRPDVRRMKVDIVGLGRKPTPVINRKILDALDSNYDIENQRYKGMWTDQKIADDLHIPRIWVSELRGSIYGPEGNAGLAEAQEMLDVYLEKCKQLEADGLAIAERAEQLALEGERIKRKLGLPTLPPAQGYFPRSSTAQERLAVIPEIVSSMTSTGKPRQKGLYLNDSERQAIRDVAKDIILERNQPMGTQELLLLMKKKGVDFKSINQKAESTRLLRILHEGGQFDREGNQQYASWWPRGAKQKA